MAAGFFISKSVGIVAIVLAVGAVATIIALSVVYSQEKNKSSSGETDGTTTTTTAAAPGTTTTAAPNNPWNRWRLPTALKPETYEVTLQPYLTPDANNMYIFRGNSSVVFVCEEATDLILIHSNKLNYTLQGNFLASLHGVDGSTPPAITRSWLEPSTQYLVVQLATPLQQGQRYRLFSNFTGELADDLSGFYRSEYTEGNVTKVVATTQMQAPDARKAFPCFDEPAMKANFTVTMIHPSDHRAISNMPARDSRQVQLDGQSWNVTEFLPTPRMSTYLLAFIVSQFDYVSNDTGGVLIRIWGRPQAIAEGQAAYALQVTGPILSFFERHYNTAYPLPKSDQVGLPDFSAGAMENWGLVTYRENSLLFDNAYSSIGNKERVVTVIAHELAHQWFGNLVTLRWWNDLWLNEGFASYVEYLGADSAEPTWDIKDLMVLNELHAVMATDALTTSHPLSFSEDEINTPAQISEVFDSIAYSKGASVLRMLSDFLTEDVFKDGLQSYLHTFAYSNTIYSDLWQHLQEAVTRNNVTLPGTISTIMDRWTLQMGFPVVTVNTLNGSIWQSHFLLDPNSTVQRPSVFNYTWIVPITWMTSSSSGDRYWLVNVSETNSSFRVSSPNWLLLNLNVSGYFRVNYNQENWEQLLAQLSRNHQVIPVINRAQIIDDAFNLASIPPNLRSAIYCSAVATGGEEAWDFVWERFREATVVSEADKLRTALTCSTEPWILQRYLQYTIDPTKIRKQDATSTINSIASNVVGQPLAWDFIRSNWDFLFSQYGVGSFSFSRLISSVTQRFSTEFELQQLERFKADNQDIGFGSGTRALEQALERTRTNINWVNENKQPVLAWLQAETGSS
ncbi:AMPN Aminopeptidase, partial [Alectura lathami]|nr:AMPN Aminopeptidase [Alectura lathami]